LRFLLFGPSMLAYMLIEPTTLSDVSRNEIRGAEMGGSSEDGELGGEERGDDNDECREVGDSEGGDCDNEGATDFVIVSLISLSSSSSSSSSIITGQSAKSPGRPSLIRCERAGYG
jgi:hypothetical protein